MPWRMRYLTTRDHPLAFAAYAATFLLGLTLLTGWVDTISLRGVEQAVTILWRAQLLTGGLVGLWAVAMSPKLTPGWPDLGDLLRLEGIAAAQAACGFAIYTTSLIQVQGRVTVPALTLGVMAVGMAARCIQAYAESRQAERLALLYDELQHNMAILSAAHGHTPDQQTFTREDAEHIQVAPVEDDTAE